MKETRKGRVFNVSIVKNFAFGCKNCYPSAPFLFVTNSVVEFVMPILMALSPYLITQFVKIIESGQISQLLTRFIFLVGVYIAIKLINFAAGIIERKYIDYTNIVKIVPYHTKLMNQKLGCVKFGLFYSKDFIDNQQMVRNAAANGYLASLSDRFFRIMGTLCGVALLIVTLYTINIYIMLMLLVPFALQLYLNYKNASKDFSLSKEAAKEARQLSRYESVLKNYRAIRETKASQSSDYVFEQWQSSYKKYQKISFKQAMSWTKIDIYCSLIQMVFTIGVIAFCIILITKGQMQIAGFAGTIAATDAILFRASSLAYDYGRLRKDALFVDCYRTFMESKDEEVQNENVPKEKFKSLEFKNVTFSYPTYGYDDKTSAIVKKEQDNPKVVLSNVSFKLNKGERIAIVGENGCGKTTITRLIAKLYDPTGGEILFNGKPLNQANLQGYRANFSVINQNYAKYEIPLRDSVLSGANKNLSDKQVENLLKKAGATDVIESANEHQGLSTWLTREFDGIKLSGGQEQKVSIARGFAGASEVMMVDEPTSALDPIVEEKILNEILNATKGKTAIVISHRLSLCTKMDRILYMGNGQIVEDGSHGELMKKKNGKYRQLFSAQAKWYN